MIDRLIYLSNYLDTWTGCFAKTGVLQSLMKPIVQLEKYRKSNYKSSSRFWVLTGAIRRLRVKVAPGRNTRMTQRFFNQVNGVPRSIAWLVWAGNQCGDTLVATCRSSPATRRACLTMRLTWTLCDLLPIDKARSWHQRQSSLKGLPCGYKTQKNKLSQRLKC